MIWKHVPTTSISEEGTKTKSQHSWELVWAGNCRIGSSRVFMWMKQVDFCHWKSAIFVQANIINMKQILQNASNSEPFGQISQNDLGFAFLNAYKTSGMIAESITCFLVCFEAHFESGINFKRLELLQVLHGLKACPHHIISVQGTKKPNLNTLESLFEQKIVELGPQESSCGWNKLILCHWKSAIFVQSNIVNMKQILQNAQILNHLAKFHKKISDLHFSMPTKRLAWLLSQ